MKIKEKNGFTLIELLAVIIILGILMIIAIPSVTSYINNSRKSAYVDTAREIISGARSFVNEGRVPMYDTDITYYINYKCISTENGSRSPYGDFVDGETYVVVTYTGNGFNYYWVSRDETGQGINTITRLDNLDEDDIVSDIKQGDIKTNIPVGSRTKTQVIDAECHLESETHAADTANAVPEEGNSGGNSQGQPSNPGQQTTSSVITIKLFYEGQEVDYSNITFKICSDSSCSNVIKTISNNETVSLNVGTYYLLATSTPAGFVPQSTPKEVTYNGDSNVLWTIDLSTGSILPSQGEYYSYVASRDSIVVSSTKSTSKGKNVKLYKIANPSINTASGWSVTSEYRNSTLENLINSGGTWSNSYKQTITGEALSYIDSHNLSPLMVALFSNSNVVAFNNLDYGIYVLDFREDTPNSAILVSVSVNN